MRLPIDWSRVWGKGKKEATASSRPNASPKAARDNEPLVLAARAYVESVHAYESICAHDGLYARAEKTQTAFTRISKISAFISLENTLSLAAKDVSQKGYVSYASKTQLIALTDRFRKIALDPRSERFLAAEANHVALGHALSAKTAEARHTMQAKLSALIAAGEKAEEGLRVAQLMLDKALGEAFRSDPPVRRPANGYKWD